MMQPPTTFSRIFTALLDGKTVGIGNTWYFNGRNMSCSGMTEDYSCCEDSYSSVEEAAKAADELGTVSSIF